MYDYLLVITFISYGLAILLGITAVALYVSMDIKGVLIENCKNKRAINNNLLIGRETILDISRYLDRIVLLNKDEFQIVQKDIEIRSNQDIWSMYGSLMEDDCN